MVIRGICRSAFVLLFRPREGCPDANVIHEPEEKDKKGNNDPQEYLLGSLHNSKEQIHLGQSNKKGPKPLPVLFQFVHHLRERFRVVHGQISKNLPVEVNSGFLQFAHQF